MVIERSDGFVVPLQLTKRDGVHAARYISDDLDRLHEEHKTTFSALLRSKIEEDIANRRNDLNEVATENRLSLRVVDGGRE